MGGSLRPAHHRASMNMPSGMWAAWGVAVGLVVAWGVGIELWAWLDRIKGNTLSEIMWSLRIPGFLWITLAGLLVSFVLGLTLHFIVRGRWGL